MKSCDFEEITFGDSGEDVRDSPDDFEDLQLDNDEDDVCLSDRCPCKCHLYTELRSTGSVCCQLSGCNMITNQHVSYAFCCFKVDDFASHIVLTFVRKTLFFLVYLLFRAMSSVLDC